MVTFVVPSDGLKNAEKLRKKKSEYIKRIDKEILYYEEMYWRSEKEFAERKLKKLKEIGEK